MAIPSTRFSTAGLPADAAWDLWQTAMASLYDTVPDPDSPFRATLDCWHLGSLLLSLCTASPMHFRRSRLITARSGLDHYLLLYCATQELTTEIDGRQNRVGCGDVTVRDMGRAVNSRGGHDQTVALAIPRDLLDPLLPKTARNGLHGLHLRAGTPLCEMLATHLRMLTGLVAVLDAHQAAMLANATLSLAALSMSGGEHSADSLAPQFPSEALSRIRAFIAAHLSDPELDAETICRQFRISRSTLYTLFKPMGGVSAYIQEQRLRRCLLDLADPRQARRRISEIAFSWGFNSDAHFSRSFKAAFGLSPSEARGAALPVPAGSLSSDHQAARRFNDWVHTLGK